MTISPSPTPPDSEPSPSSFQISLDPDPDRRNRISQQTTTTTSSQFYQGGTTIVPPSLTTDYLHPPPTTTRPRNERNNSWRELLLKGGAEEQPESTTIQEDQVITDTTHQQGQGAEEEEEERSRSRSRSKSKNRRYGGELLPWYKRPSPIWLLPGTFLMSISMGLTFAPKLEIYTQLICRSMDPLKSKVTLPPPVLEKSSSSSLTTTTSPPPILSLGSTTTNENHETSYYEFEFLNDFIVEETREEKEEEKEEKKRRSRAEDWSNQCHRSSAVQSSVARLALILTLLMGILSSLTTGWWGSYSDRKGRKPVLILAMLGTVLMDTVFLITVNFHDSVSYNFLLLGPILDGLLGGFSTAQATTNAYLSDVTLPGSRAKIFSLLAGLMFAGFALGPILSSLLIEYSSKFFGIKDPTQVVLIPFYIALISHSSYLIVLSFGLPESLSQSRKEISQKRYQEELKVRKERDQEMDKKARQGGNFKVWIRRFARSFERVFSFLRPLGLLLPKERYDEEQVEEELRSNIDWGKDLKEYRNPRDVWNDGQVRRGKDWSLTKIAIGYSSYMMIIAIIQVKLQYANYTFDWSAKEDGLFLSYIGVLRVVALLVFLPLFIRLLRRPAPLPIRPKPEESNKVEFKKWEKEEKWLKVVTDSHFDLRLASLSLLLDLFGFLLFSLISLSPHPTPFPFLFATFIQSLGSGASPTLQSLALAHSTPRDSGRLFASFSVVQSLSSQVVGPILFGTTFINSVGKGSNGQWSGMVFWLASFLCLISFSSIKSLRLRKIWLDPELMKKSVVNV
ncbi:hypothetical protein JCM3765_006709 [Sporobolomyces pararoseus]